MKQESIFLNYIVYFLIFNQDFLTLDSLKPLFGKAVRLVSTFEYSEKIIFIFAATV